MKLEPDFLLNGGGGGWCAYGFRIFTKLCIVFFFGTIYQNKFLAQNELNYLLMHDEPFLN